jgi:hypothetical protein
MDVVVGPDEFQALFRHLWISPTVATIQVSVSVPCFQHSTTRLTPGPEDVVVLEGGRRFVAGLYEISVHMGLTSSIWWPGPAFLGFPSVFKSLAFDPRYSAFCSRITQLSRQRSRP